jgi:heme/copper-type cytochrome/quinol oxidase subunit 2
MRSIWGDRSGGRGTAGHEELGGLGGQWQVHRMVQWAMFYVIVFSLAAVLLVVAGLTAVSRRRRDRAAEETQGGPTHAPHSEHGTHADAAERRNRKVKRAQSQHDRRKRH